MLATDSVGHNSQPDVWGSALAVQIGIQMCITNEGFCIQMTYFVLKMMTFGRRWLGRAAGADAVGTCGELIANLPLGTGAAFDLADVLGERHTVPRVHEPE